MTGLQVEAHCEGSGEGNPMLTWRLASACSIEAAGTAARASDGAAKATRATRNVRKSMVGGKEDVRVRNGRGPR